jgi:hypothetical protein
VEYRRSPMLYDLDDAIINIATKLKERINVLDTEIKERRDKLWLDGLETIVASVEGVKRVEVLRTGHVEEELAKMVSEKRGWEQMLDALNNFKMNKLMRPDVTRQIKALDDKIKNLIEPHD